MQKSLETEGTFVHLFTDDPVYRLMYEQLLAEAVIEKKLSFGPHSLDINDTTAVAAKKGRQRFERSTSAEQAAVEFTIM